MNTKNPLIRNQIAFILADLGYSKAIPFIIQKINEEELYNNNGSLVYALGQMDVKNEVISFIKIICEQGYEARQTAFETVHDLSNYVSHDIRQKSLEILNFYKNKFEAEMNDHEHLDPLHFIKETIKLMNK